ncbi:MAG: class I SAM-dependent methyltransferase [Pseudomonadota bacterium]
MRPGQSFQTKEAAEYYKYRPEYPGGLFQKLYDLSPRHGRALDLGCGNGKVAREIASVFDWVTAVDVSAAMLKVARELQGTSTQNIRWVCQNAEEIDGSDGPYDLIVAAASIHWMDHEVLFPRLLNHVAVDHVFAVVDGDGAHQPPWQHDWDSFLTKWIYDLTGEHYEPDRDDSSYALRMTRHNEWLDIENEFHFEHDVVQSIDEFVGCQLSRDTFAPARLGERVSEFTEELRQILFKHADGSGMLKYRVVTAVETGKIRR